MHSFTHLKYALGTVVGTGHRVVRKTVQLQEAYILVGATDLIPDIK